MQLNLLSSSTHERNETQNQTMWTAGYKWNKDMTIAAISRISEEENLFKL